MEATEAMDECGTLVLSRKEGGAVRITVPPSDRETVIEVAVIEIRGYPRKVRLTFAAPRRVPIYRTELLERMAAAGRPGQPQ